MRETMKTQKLKAQKGMTLIELIISTFVLVTVLGSSMFLLKEAQTLSQEARSRLLALSAARSTLEAIKATALVNVPAINTTSYIPAGLTNGAVTISTNPANLVGVNVATVTVNVTWIGARNIQKTLQISTMRSRF